MTSENLIPVNRLCTLYKVEIAFFNELSDSGLIHLKTLDRMHYIHEDEIVLVEKVVRLHQELDINTAGIETIIHLLRKVEKLQTELQDMQNRLKLYED
ncbi:hypothetical protein GCM10028791_35120 [Echinicola sediminis]